MGKYQLSERSAFEIVIMAAFIAIVSFGGIAGVLAVAIPQVFFSTAAPVICTTGETMKIDEWYDGESNQMRILCVNPATGVEKERTVLFLGVVLGALFLVIFWAVWGVLMLARMAAKTRG